MPIINVRECLAQISVAEPILVRAALALAREQYFEPAVEVMKEKFDSHDVTQELDAAAEDPVGTDNISNTLKGLNHAGGRNLFGFIGFDAGDTPTDNIRDFLDERSDGLGPTIKYVRGSQVKNLVFSFVIQAPNKKAIYDSTPLPWLDGNVSWAERIEIGLPGLGNYLNKPEQKNSRSTAGIQVKRTIHEAARFKNRSYLTEIFGDFLARF